MRHYLFIFFLFFISINANAQTGKAKITGTVLDATTKEPIDFATITVFKSGTKSVVNGISSDIKGNFTV
ncbi:MAG: hypothetical protein EOO88_40445 [Pedobacter sp.]|nr:MAG: hypothetical protein EOO88_40445 [Pedobacter sp.]